VHRHGHGLGDAEIHELDDAVFGHHDVAGLQVAVDDAVVFFSVKLIVLVVGVIERRPVMMPMAVTPPRAGRPNRR